jgi:hypothetical protein
VNWSPEKKIALESGNQKKNYAPKMVTQIFFWVVIFGKPILFQLPLFGAQIFAGYHF